MSGSDFWSRRKAAVEAERVSAEAEQVRAAVEAPMEERPDDELLAEFGLPVPEQIESVEDVQKFLGSALPQRLKTRALRKLWSLNPVLANVDGLVDYGEDFTDSAMVVENLQTVYQVGKGIVVKLTETMENIEETLAEEEEEIAEEFDLEEEPEDIPAPSLSQKEADIPEPLEDVTTIASAPRRMRFVFAPGT